MWWPVSTTHGVAPQLLLLYPGPWDPLDRCKSELVKNDRVGDNVGKNNMLARLIATRCGFQGMCLVYIDPNVSIPL
jgi:hypothetical protein